MNSLVIGYGSAGKRHKKILETIGVRTYSFDPYKDAGADFTKYSSAMGYALWDVITIATPPYNHLDYIEKIFERFPNAWIMCEKPLCDFGSMNRARSLARELVGAPIQVSYNYRYHNILDINRYMYSEFPVKDVSITLHAEQHRDRIPSWGLLLDHVSHDVDILRFFAIPGDKIVSVKNVIHIDNDESEVYSISMETEKGKSLLIEEMVIKKNSVRRVYVLFESRKKVYSVPIEANNKMFFSMWASFLRAYHARDPNSLYPTLQSALETQEVLKMIRDKELEDE